MGYTTDFNGTFKLNKTLDADTKLFLTKFNETRRMKRDSAKLKKKYGKDFGTEGEFFVEGDGFMGQDRDDTVIDGNNPPSTQPGLWCQWIPTEDGTGIEWDQGEKFYDYVEWLQYLITNVLEPRGYSLTGDVQWSGESFGDIGVIQVIDNKIKTYAGVHKAPKAKKPKVEKPKSNPTLMVSTRTMDDGKFFEAKSLIKAMKTIKKEGDDVGMIIGWLEELAERR